MPAMIAVPTEARMGRTGRYAGAPHVRTNARSGPLARGAVWKPEVPPVPVPGPRRHQSTPRTYARPTEPRFSMRIFTIFVISAMPALPGFFGSNVPGFSAM